MCLQIPRNPKPQLQYNELFPGAKNNLPDKLKRLSNQAAYSPLATVLGMSARGRWNLFSWGLGKRCWVILLDFCPDFDFLISTETVGCIKPLYLRVPFK